MILRTRVLLLPILLAVGLAGCAPALRHTRALPTTTVQERADILQRSAQWSFGGRIAVSDGKDGGSGRIQWRQDGPWYEVNVRAPVAGGSWRLSGTDGMAQLDGARPETLRDVDAEALLARELGWRVPFSSMQYWVRGMPRSPTRTAVRGDADGMPGGFVEHGWQVEYLGWVVGPVGLPMPKRLVARKPPYELRLTVDRWNLDVPD